MRSLMVCIPHQILLRLSNRENEVDRACSTYGEEEWRIQFCCG